MGEVKWIKITTNMFEDEKIDFIESLPESDAILVIWIKLLTLAGKNKTNGYTKNHSSQKHCYPISTVFIFLTHLPPPYQL